MNSLTWRDAMYETLVFTEWSQVADGVSVGHEMVKISLRIVSNRIGHIEFFTRPEFSKKKINERRSAAGFQP